MKGRLSTVRFKRKPWGSSVATVALLSTATISVPTNSYVAPIPVRGPTIVAPLCTTPLRLPVKLFSTITDRDGTVPESKEEWSDFLLFEDASHRSARILVPKGDDDAFDSFPERLKSTVTACRELGKSSIWVEVPMHRCSLIETGEMSALGFQFHHAVGETAVLNLWLKDSESKVPEFATHNVGVGAVVVNSRDEILCVRELRKNYMPWKTPTGLSNLGEQIDEAAVREVLEETGIRTKFHSILSFRQTHDVAHGRSDLFFVCRLDPIEERDANDNPIIDMPTAQACEIEKAEWVPLSVYRTMINDQDHGHPMMRHVIEMYDAGKHIGKDMVNSVIPGRKPNSLYYPSFDSETDPSLSN
jgi:ADP-ribose pyrophosphatase YjhB (NUDIX family)